MAESGAPVPPDADRLAGQLRPTIARSRRLSTDVPTGRAVAYLFDGLTRSSPRNGWRWCQTWPKSWEVSQDGLTYTFHLARNVHFHDGTLFSAAGRKTLSVRADLGPSRLAEGEAGRCTRFCGAREYAARERRASIAADSCVLNDSTVRMTLTEPFAIFPKMLAMPVTAIVPQRIPPDFGEHPIGTGPWKFVEWRHDDYLLFARNASYHGGATKHGSAGSTASFQSQARRSRSSRMATSTFCRCQTGKRIRGEDE